MIVDVEHHFRVLREGHDPKVERRWTEDGILLYSQGNSGADVDEHIWFMDGAGIDVAVLTGNLGSPELATVQKWHDSCAKAVSDHPDRFVGFATASATGGKPFLDEIGRAVNELGMKGVHISARPDGVFLDDKALWPFYEKICELDVPLDIHVETYPKGFDALLAPYILSYVMAREFDITATVFRICLGGVLEAFPDLKLIVNHSGGGVTAVAERMDYYVGLCGEDTYRGEALTSQHWRTYFDKLYFNIAGRGPGIGTLKCALTCISPDKLMFGSDWPPNFEDDPARCKAFIDDIRALDLPQSDIDGILGGNAARLLGIPGG